MIKIGMTKTKENLVELRFVLDFGHCRFEIVSDLDIRIFEVSHHF